MEYVLINCFTILKIVAIHSYIIIKGAFVFEEHIFEVIKISTFFPNAHVEKSILKIVPKKTLISFNVQKVLFLSLKIRFSRICLRFLGDCSDANIGIFQ